MTHYKLINADEDFDDEEHIPLPLDLFNPTRIHDRYQLPPTPLSRQGARAQSSTVDSPMLNRSAFLAGKTNNFWCKRIFQVAKELSDLVVYCQSEKFKGFKDLNTMGFPLISNSVKNSPSASLSSPKRIKSYGDTMSTSIYKCSSIQESEA